MERDYLQSVEITKLPKELYNIAYNKYPYIEETRKFIKDIVMLTRVVKEGRHGNKMLNKKYYWVVK